MRYFRYNEEIKKSEIARKLHRLELMLKARKEGRKLPFDLSDPDLPEFFGNERRRSVDV